MCHKHYNVRKGLRNTSFNGNLSMKLCTYEKIIMMNNLSRQKFQFVKKWYIVIIGWETYDLWLTCDWFNQKNKALNNLKFEIKSLNMFQLHKKWGKIL
jgi:hypothetical protein